MKNIVLFKVVTLLVFVTGCSSMTSVNELAALKRDSVQNQVERNQRLKSEADAKHAESITKGKIADQKKAEADQKWAEEVRKGKEADQKKAQHEAAREKAEADQKNAEARRAADEKEKERFKFENERNVRFANALKIGADFTIDYTSEAAWAEQAFISNEGRYRARKFSLSDGAAQTALRAEYARLMRMLSGGKTISRNDYVQMFVGAVALGRARVASKIFDKVRDVNVVSSFDPRKRTLLMWALEGLDEATLDFVWNLKPDVDKKDATGATALHYALRRGQLNDVKILTNVNKGLVNEADERGETPVYIAIRHSRADLLEHLLAKQADVKIKNKAGVSPFVCACLQGNIDIMEMIEKKGHIVTCADFISAVKGGHLSVVRWFVEKRYFSVNAPGVMVAAKSSISKDIRVHEYLCMRGGQ